MLIGVAVLFVLGLIIGNLMGRHTGKPNPAKHAQVRTTATPDRLPVVQPLPRIQFLPTASPSPHPLPTGIGSVAPSPPATPLPHATPTSLTSPRATPTPSPRATASVSVVPSPVSTATPQPRHTRYPVTSEMLSGRGMHGPRYAQPTHSNATAIVAPAPTSAVKSATPHPHSTHAISEPHATPVPLSKHIAIPTPLPTPVTVTPTRRAERLVRRYLRALVSGDEVTAFHALGTTPGDKNANLAEETFIDHGAKITSVMGQTDAAGISNVQAEVDAKHGLYFLTFKVEPKDGQLVITQHDFIKP